MTVARRDTAGASLLCVRAFPHPVFIFINVSSYVKQRAVQQSPETVADTSFPHSTKGTILHQLCKGATHHTNEKQLVNIWYVKALY